LGIHESVLTSRLTSVGKDDVQNMF
jgi:hypothetical protein